MIIVSANLCLPMVDEVYDGGQGPVLDSSHVYQGVGVRVPSQQVPENRKRLRLIRNMTVSPEEDAG